MRLVVYGHSGSGKSTATIFLKTYFEEQGASVTILKLAKPLYHLQQEFYRIAGIRIKFYWR
jgi:thymidylate kinase